MPLTNYQIPGVYVTQSGTSLVSIAPNSLNITIVADQATPGTATDTFYGVTGSGAIVGQLSTPMVNTTYTGTYTAFSGFSVTWVSGTTTTTGVSGVNFNLSTPTGQPFTFITTSGITGTPVSGTVSVTYGHNWGAYGSYTNFNALSSAIGTAVSGTTVLNPAVLAAQLAYQNGAKTVNVLPVARVSGVTAANDADWLRVFNASAVGSDQTYLANFVGTDVVVPLYGFVTSSGTVQTAGAGTVASGVNSYLTTQSGNGVFQRAFIGVNGTQNQATTSGLQTLASGLNSTRVSLVFPASITYNPGFNTATALASTNFNIPGYYLAAAIAGTFVGQPSVATPVTNKQVSGFVDVPNQISAGDAQTNYLPYGILTVRKKRDGNFWILHGLTTNVNNWFTAEVSINAIGDRLANQIKSDLDNSFLVGGPLTKNTSAAVLGTVQATLTNAVSNGLIQSYQNLALTTNPATPTTVNVTFQYAPTYPISYIQVTLSLNSQTGQITYGNAQSNFVVY